MIRFLKKKKTLLIICVLSVLFLVLGMLTPANAQTSNSWNFSTMSLGEFNLGDIGWSGSSTSTGEIMDVAGFRSLRQPDAVEEGNLGGVGSVYGYVESAENTRYVRYQGTVTVEEVSEIRSAFFGIASSVTNSSGSYHCRIRIDDDGSGNYLFRTHNNTFLATGGDGSYGFNITLDRENDECRFDMAVTQTENAVNTSYGPNFAISHRSDEASFGTIRQRIGIRSASFQQTDLLPPSSPGSGIDFPAHGFNDTQVSHGPPFSITASSTSATTSDVSISFNYVNTTEGIEYDYSHVQVRRQRMTPFEMGITQFLDVDTASTTEGFIEIAIQQFDYDDLNTEYGWCFETRLADGVNFSSSPSSPWRGPVCFSPVELLEIQHDDLLDCSITSGTGIGNCFRNVVLIGQGIVRQIFQPVLDFPQIITSKFPFSLLFDFQGFVQDAGGGEDINTSFNIEVDGKQITVLDIEASMDQLGGDGFPRIYRIMEVMIYLAMLTFFIRRGWSIFNK